MSLFSISHAVLAVSVLVLAACAPGSSSYQGTHNDGGIIGGTNVAENTALASSIVGIYDLQVGAICTGSLYNSDTILTAAHCVGPNPEKMFIVFAADMMSVLKSNDGTLIRQRVRRVVSAHVHPGWEPSKNSQKEDTWNDIAVVKFSGTIPAGFKPATLLTDLRDLSPTTSVTLAGYGVSEMQVTAVDPKKVPDLSSAIASGQLLCNRDQTACVTMKSSGSGVLRSTQVAISKVLPNEIVLDQTVGRGACSGDSGGPAYVQKNGQYYLWGITSRGSVGCGIDGIYTNILTYKDWIAAQ